MTGFFKLLLSTTVVVFPVASMLAVGVSYTLKEITGPLRHVDRVFRALAVNFVLVPLLALGIARALHLEPSLEAGVLLVGTAAGAPFLLKLTQAANADVGLSAALLVLLMPLSVLFMPLVVPLFSDVPVDAVAIAVPLVLTLLLPFVVGLAIDALFPRVAARLKPLASLTSSIALALLVTSTVVLNWSLFGELLGTGAFSAAVLVTAGAFVMGYLISSPGFDRRAVMGLGAGQRNIAAALVVAADGMTDRKTLVMVVLFSVVDLMVLFPIAWVLKRASGGQRIRATVA